MATGSEAEAKFSINLEGDAAEVSEKTASSLEVLRQSIQRSQDAVRNMSGSLRNLRGSTNEIKGAKEQLRAKIDAERDAISRANLALLKEGTTYDALARKTKELADRQKKLDSEKVQQATERTKNLTSAIGKGGGPIAELSGKFSSLGEIVSGAGGGMATFALAAVAVVAALVKVGQAAVGATIALGKFILTGADELRSMGLVREAVTGSAEDAARLGSQVDALAGKVPTAKGALNELAVSLRKNGLSGQTLVDTFNAVGQASAALGDDAGSKLRGIIERGRLSQRMFVNPMELMGSGVSFDDIAKALSKSMKVGVNDAKSALLQGRVKLADGAAAIRAAVEKNLGKVNAKQMLSLPTLVDKFHETLTSLTSGVDLDGLLEQAGQLMKSFSSATVTGAAMKQLVTDFGTGMVSALRKAIPVAKEFVEQAVITGLRVEIAYKRIRNALYAAFGKKTIDNINLAKYAMDLIDVSAELLNGALIDVVATIGEMIPAAKAVLYPFQMLFDLASKLTGGGSDSNAAGQAIGTGFAQGISSKETMVRGAVEQLGAAAKDQLRKDLKIHSPSLVFRDMGQRTSEGYAAGVDDGAPDAKSSVSSMAAPPTTPSSPPPRGAVAGAVSRGGSAPIAVTINVEAGGGGKEIAQALSEPSFLRRITKAVEDALTGAGVPVQS